MAFSGNGGKTIFAQMTTGKSGDTIQLKKLDTATVDKEFLAKLKTEKVVKDSDSKTVLHKDGQILVFRNQSSDGLIETCIVAVNLCLKLIGFMTFFMGLMSIAEVAGGVRLLSKIIGPFFSKIFPEIPKGHPSLGHMTMNFSANLLGLDNAATPFGIKAMQSLQELNPKKDTASNAQI